MRRSLVLLTTAALTAGSFALVAPGCGGSDGSTFDPNGSSADGSFLGNDGGFGGSDACTGLQCQQTVCASGGKTTVTGTVYDPAGKVPLYNVIVYVPNAPVQPLASNGASCDKCGATVSGSPVVTALTDSAGKFVLENVPVGDNIPLVMQVGKWRRQIVIPSVASCADTPLTDKNLTRLPRNKSEGDIPQIALTTGGADPLECLPRKIGIDDSEFTAAGGTGRVHLYAGYGYDTTPTTNGAKKFDTKLNGGAAFTDAKAFWSDLGNLKKYDIVLLACEGDTNPDTKPDTARKALYDYASAGGRVFASHWHRYWFDDAVNPSPFPAVGTWNDRSDPTGGPPASIDGTVDTSFPKGIALRDWLVNVKASAAPGKLPIVESKHNLDAVDPNKAQQWITLANPKANNRTAVEYATFNAPVGAAPADQCGRVVYSDLHVSSGDTIGQPFPSGCTTTDLSPQEKALEFMLFDLSSCIQDDNSEPVPPPR